ncbi:hypothetical protein SUGI_0208580 [Cryptomeria japonica]|nr:hypothetical protein SUGI_0208580 [Cryptomeria japonica]
MGTIKTKFYRFNDYEITNLNYAVRKPLRLANEGEYAVFRVFPRAGYPYKLYIPNHKKTDAIKKPEELKSRRNHNRKKKPNVDDEPVEVDDDFSTILNNLFNSPVKLVDEHNGDLLIDKGEEMGMIESNKGKDMCIIESNQGEEMGIIESNQGEGIQRWLYDQYRLRPSDINMDPLNIDKFEAVETFKSVYVRKEYCDVSADLQDDDLMQPIYRIEQSIGTSDQCNSPPKLTSSEMLINQDENWGGAEMFPNLDLNMVWKGMLQTHYPDMNDVDIFGIQRMAGAGMLLNELGNIASTEISLLGEGDLTVGIQSSRNFGNHNLSIEEVLPNQNPELGISQSQISELDIAENISQSQNPELGIAENISQNQNPELGIADIISQNQNPELGIAENISQNQNPELGIAEIISQNQNPELGIAEIVSQNQDMNNADSLGTLGEEPEIMLPDLVADNMENSREVLNQSEEMSERQDASTQKSSRSCSKEELPSSSSKHD